MFDKLRSIYVKFKYKKQDIPLFGVLCSLPSEETNLFKLLKYIVLTIVSIIIGHLFGADIISVYDYLMELL